MLQSVVIVMMVISWVEASALLTMVAAAGCSSTRRAGASPRGYIGLVGDGCCYCSAVVLVVLVLLLAEGIGLVGDRVMLL
jgi:hypothetical protein